MIDCKASGSITSETNDNGLGITLGPLSLVQRKVARGAPAPLA